MRNNACPCWVSVHKADLHLWMWKSLPPRSFIIEGEHFSKESGMSNNVVFEKTYNKLRDGIY